MKAISTLTLIAVIAAFATPNTAKAGNKEEAIIGGIIGGLIIGAVIADDDCDTQVSVGYHNNRYSNDHGYWKWVSVKTWVPGYYERSCDRHGHVRKVWISGHYSWTKEKVWVSAGHHNYRGHEGYSYRNNHRNNDHRDNRYDNRRDKSRDNRQHERSSQIVRRF